MTDTYSIVLLGAPRSKARPRFSKGKCYDPQKDYVNSDRIRIKSKMGCKVPTDVPVALECIFVFEPAKSNKAKHGDHHAIKPDVDNLLKWVMDVGNSVLWEDDKLVARVSGIKVYGDVAKTIMTIRTLDDPK